mgnify:CR=1 FL=1
MYERESFNFDIPARDGPPLCGHGLAHLSSLAKLLASLSGHAQLLARLLGQAQLLARLLGHAQLLAIQSGLAQLIARLDETIFKGLDVLFQSESFNLTYMQETVLLFALMASRSSRALRSSSRACQALRSSSRSSQALRSSSRASRALLSSS